jgi:hypothetical protein
MTAQAEAGLPTELGDRAGIEELLARYVIALDLDDIEAAIALFTDDGEFRSHDHVWAGTDRLRRLFGNAPAGMHLGGRAVITVDGDEGTVRTQLVFYPADRTPHRLAVYDDVVVRVGGRWRFRSRDCRYLRRDGSLGTWPDEEDLTEKVT